MKSLFQQVSIKIKHNLKLDIPKYMDIAITDALTKVAIDYVKHEDYMVFDQIIDALPNGTWSNFKKHMKTQNRKTLQSNFNLVKTGLKKLSREAGYCAEQSL